MHSGAVVHTVMAVFPRVQAADEVGGGAGRPGGRGARGARQPQAAAHPAGRRPGGHGPGLPGARGLSRLLETLGFSGNSCGCQSGHPLRRRAVSQPVLLACCIRGLLSLLPCCAVECCMASASASSVAGLLAFAVNGSVNLERCIVGKDPVEPCCGHVLGCI